MSNTTSFTRSSKSKPGDLEDQLSNVSIDTTSNSVQNSRSDNPPKFTPEDVDEEKSLGFDRNQLVHTITTNDDEPDIIYIDNKRFYKNEVLSAFGGSLVPGFQPRSQYDFANAAPLGLCAFALTTFVSSLIDLEASSVTNNNIVVSIAIFYGGFAQFIAGMWCIASNNSFAGTALSSYGSYWMAWGILNIDFFGIASSYASEEEWRKAQGIFFVGWTIYTYMMTMLTFKSTVAFFTLFCFVCLTYTLITVTKFTGSIGVQKAAGVAGVITALLAWYNAYAGLATRENSYLVPPVFQLSENVFQRSQHSHLHKKK